MLQSATPSVGVIDRIITLSVAHNYFKHYIIAITCYDDLLDMIKRLRNRRARNNTTRLVYRLKGSMCQMAAEERFLSNILGTINYTIIPNY